MKHTKRLIDVSGLRDIVERRIPVVCVDSQIPGPVLLLTACIHGDEVGGIAIVHDVITALKHQPLLKGSVHGMPLINSMGFENVSRYINTDREDLNSCFPGDALGTIGQRIARRLLDNILRTNPTLVIDLHNDWVRSIPYALIDPPGDYPTAALADRVRELATASGLLTVEDHDVFHATKNTLSGALTTAGVAAFTVEAGGAYSITEDNVRAGTRAVLSTLHALGMIDKVHASAPASEHTQPLRYANPNLPLCTRSGLIRFEVSPGQEVKKNQVLARVYSAFGSLEETLRTEVSGIILGLTDHARVMPGREVVAIAQTPDSGAF
jgi:predicted deacylase